MVLDIYFLFSKSISFFALFQCSIAEVRLPLLSAGVREVTKTLLQ